MTTSVPEAAGSFTDAPDVSDRSLGELVGNVANDLSTLMRQEIDLAKAELRQEVSKAGQAGGMFAGAGIAGLMILIFLSVALWWGLSNVMDGGWAGLIVAAIWAAIAAVLFVVARNRLRQVRGLPLTAETAKEIPTAVKPNTGGYR
jgi:ABC-type multidrug transport system fused ATPase/permease subunit